MKIKILSFNKIVLVQVFLIMYLCCANIFADTTKKIPIEFVPYTSSPNAGNPDMGLFTLGYLSEISDNKNNVLEKYSNNPYIVGFDLSSAGHINWTFLEPEENEFNWTLLDDFVNSFKKYKKRYIFEIYTAQGSFSRNFSTPHWLFAKGATKLCAGSVWIRLGNTNYSPDVQPLKWSGYKNEFNVPYNNPVGNGTPDIIQINDSLNNGLTKVVTYEGREARSTDKINGQNYIYFNVDYEYINNLDGFQKYKNDTNAKTVLTICYFDNGTDTITVEYDDINNQINEYTKANILYTNYYSFYSTKTVTGIQKTNTLKWKTASFYILPANLRFENSKNGGYDIRITSTGSDDVIIDYLDISTFKPRDMEADVAPNWHDNTYFEYWKRFLSKLNERYGQDTAFDLIRMTGFGRWNEMTIVTYGNKDWVNILSGVYGIDATNKSDPLSETKDLNEDVLSISNGWRWPRHENIMKKFIDFYNTTFLKPVELTVKVPFGTYHSYTSSLVELVNYASLKSNVIFNQATYNNEKTFSVEKYWDTKIQTHEGAALDTNLAFYGTNENSWKLRFKNIYDTGWIDSMKKILANHANYSYLYTGDTDIINYDSLLDNLNPSEEKAIAKEQGTKALRYLTTHLGYHIESLEPDFPDITSSIKKTNIKTKWLQKGNGKPYRNYKIFYALANLNNNSVIDLGAYYPVLPTNKWYNDFKIEDPCVNIIPNSSFEQNFSNWSISSKNTPQIDKTIFWDSDNKSVHFKSDGAASSYIQSNYIVIEPNTQYSISAWAKGINIQKGTNTWNLLCFAGKFYDSSYIGVGYCDLFFDTGTFDWSYKYAVATSPPNAKYFRIDNAGIYANGKGEAWIDKLVFKKYVSYSKVKNWQDSDPPFYIENTQEITIPYSISSNEYKLIVGLVTDEGYRIKLTNERDENGTITPDDLFDDIYGMEYYQSEKSIYVDNIPPTTSVSLPGGEYSTTKIVTLTTNKTATIYYTLNGAEPTISSKIFTEPIAITNEGITILKFFAQDLVENKENVQTATYNIDTTPPVINIISHKNNAEVTLTPINVIYTVDGIEKTSIQNLVLGINTIKIEEKDKFDRSSQESIKVNFNPKLTAIEQKISLSEDTTITIDLKAYNPLKDKLLLNIDTQPVNGILNEPNQINDTTAQVIYTPNKNFNGNDSFIFKVTNTFGVTSSAPISITIVPKNDQPVINLDTTYSVNEGETLQLTINATDPDGDNLNYSVINLPVGATFNNFDHIFFWKPEYHQAGEYKVTFEVTDGFLSNQKEITIKVLNINQNPEVTISTEKSSAFAPLSVTFTANAFDPDGEIVNYFWDFNEDNIFDTTLNSNMITHFYNEKGSYYTKVKVVDNDGASAEDFFIVKIIQKDMASAPSSSISESKNKCVITKILSAISMSEITKYINRFRDAKLLNSIIGKKIINGYYGLHSLSNKSK
ncbi:MAG: chitobiase/beta-hexosaminidase C-terminal domain-containing protein [Candidatus Firestonebacteria bacterium]|nr:chitobiase/beta-hexosaminidase C-terminal domain-containing protein [Candidatus Firestonebacteria bacterium]